MDREEDKLADDVDVAIFYGRGNWSGLRTERLYAEFLLPVCAPGLLTGENGLKVPSDLANHTLLHDTSRRDWLAYTRQLGYRRLMCSKARYLATVPWWFRLRFMVKGLLW